MTEQQWDFAVKVECPTCGQLAWWIARRQDGTQQDTRGKPHQDCGPLRFPESAVIASAIERARARPVVPGRPYDGRTARVRGRR